MTRKKDVFVIGHKNPDTDSICSAIAYANLKNKISDGNYVPKRAGEVSNETQYVLDFFGVESPAFINHVGTQVKDVTIKITQPVQRNVSEKRMDYYERYAGSDHAYRKRRQTGRYHFCQRYCHSQHGYL